jgi:hypothetical protein
MADEIGHQYPIQDSEDLRKIAKRICQEMEGTDDALAMAAGAIAGYPPLYAAALGIMVAKLSDHADDADRGEWMAKFLLALAQDRVLSVFDRSGRPHWPYWMEDDT